MIYLDNAATCGFRPRQVTDAVNTVINYLSANPGRASHRLAVTGQKITFSAREKLGELFNAEPERVIFTKNCTEALNIAIFGLFKDGGHVITTVYEHNSVLRPLFHLRNLGKITLDVISPMDVNEMPRLIKEKINDKTCLIVCSAVSNVTGVVLPIEEIAQIANNYSIPFIVDGAQGAGHIPLSVKNVTALAVAGHKGLYGIMGSGALILNKNAEVRPLTFGGTGTETFDFPTTYPEKLEAGTLNLPAITALSVSADYVIKNMHHFGDCLYDYTVTAHDYLSKLDGVWLYSSPNKTGIVTFKLNEKSSSEVADELSFNYDIAVRGGFHCAPLLHEYLNTKECGLVRASFAVQNTYGELSAFLNAVRKIANG